MWPSLLHSDGRRARELPMWMTEVAPAEDRVDEEDWQSSEAAAAARAAEAATSAQGING